MTQVQSSTPALGLSVNHSAARTLATVIAPPLMAAAIGAALAAFLPLSEPVRCALGYHAVVPLWAAFTCILPLQRSGRRAWAACALVCLPLSAALLIRAIQG